MNNLTSPTTVLSGLVLAALHLEAAHGVDGLRGEAEVVHDGDLGVEHAEDLARLVADDRPMLPVPQDRHGHATV